VWIIKSFPTASSSGGSSTVSWSSLEGSPEDNQDLVDLIQANIPDPANKRILIPFATHTGNTNKTTLFTKVIHANTMVAGTIITLKPQWDNSLSSGVSSAMMVEIGGVAVMNFSTSTGKSYFREQQVYITAVNANNNTYFRIVSGTG